MTSKLKCPFCETELEKMHDKKLLGCPKCWHIADGAFWVKAIQAKQDLKIATKALREIRYYKSAGFDLPAQTPWEVIADIALEKIEHKE